MPRRLIAENVKSMINDLWRLAQLDNPVILIGINATESVFSEFNVSCYF